MYIQGVLLLSITWVAGVTATQTPCRDYGVLKTTQAMMTTSKFEDPTPPHSTDNPNDSRGYYEYGVDAWFRLEGEGGTEILDHEPNDVNICATPYPGWINGILPTTEEPNTETILCHKNEESDCYRSSRIFIQKCKDFLVYRFPDVNLIVYPPGLFCTQISKVTPVTPVTPEKPETPETPDPCAAKPCGKHGICYALGIGYKCVCAAGYAGRHCGTNINECASSPCLHGGTCADEVDSYKCNCPPGLSGKNCEINNDDCQTHHCKNGGKCVDGVNGYFCFCALGYVGVTCETNENNCAADNPCQNEGTCRDKVNTYSCQCAAGFEGKNCEKRISKCNNGPCRNGGTCVDSENSYKCTCAPGYGGKNCDTKFTHCDWKPCENGGTCVSNELSFTCTCLPGWSGRTCDDKGKIQGLVDEIDKTINDDGTFSMDDLYKKVEDVLDLLSNEDSNNEEDSITDKLGEKMEKAVKKFLVKKFEKAFDKLKSKLPKKNCGDLNLANAVNNFKRGYQNCLKNRRKKCKDEGKKDREENGEKEEEEEEEEEEENENEGDEEENEEENEGCRDKCPAVDNISHGRHEGTNFDCGHSVTFSCDDGYQIIGCETPECKITCEKGGTWSSTPPTCEKKTCGGLITLSSTNPQITLSIPTTQEHQQSTVDCTWVIITTSHNELNIDFPGVFTKIPQSRYDCARHFVEIRLGSQMNRVCQTTRAYQRSFPNMVAVRLHSTELSQVTFNARVSIVNDFYETSNMNSEWSKRARGVKRKKECDVAVNDWLMWPMETPIIMTGTNNAMLPDKTTMILDLTNIGKFKASCMNKSFQKYPNAPFLWVECQNGELEVRYSQVTAGTRTRPPKTKVVKDEKLTFSDIFCDKVPEPTVKTSPAHHKIVWEIDGGIIDVIKSIFFDSNTKIPKSASHTIHGKTIQWNQPDANRPSFRTTPDIPKSDQMDPEIYPMAKQREMFKSINSILENKIDCCLNNHLVHGHMVPNADFFYKSWRRATFYMTNVAPQWQAINAGNWLVVENAVRKYAQSREEDMDITTGTHGVLTLSGHRIILPTTQPGGTPATPVPSHFWKVLQDSKAGKSVAFVIVNNPYATSSHGLPSSTDKMCPTQCPLLQGKTPTPSKGLLMCCSPRDLQKKIPDVPIIAGSHDLFNSLELKNALNVK